MTDLRVFREYEPWECGDDGYPYVWSDLAWERRPPVGVDVPVMNYTVRLGVGPGVGVKDLVREEAGFRCARCGHPYRPGAGAWGDDPDAPGLTPPSGLLRMFEDGHAFVTPPRSLEKQMRGRPPLWSPCDGECRHGGPLRAMTTEGWRPFECEPSALGAAAETVEVQASWRILTVHHLNGRKHDLRWFNLAPLCQRDHLYIQGKVQMERVYPYEHSDWFKPYAAAWYAYSYLGELLTREETMARLDELLALERMA